MATTDYSVLFLLKSLGGLGYTVNHLDPVFEYCSSWFIFALGPGAHILGFEAVFCLSLQLLLIIITTTYQ